MLELEPPRHTRLRGLVLRAFTSRRIAALAPEIAALSHRLIDALPAGRVDLLPAFARRLPVTVIARLLGRAGRNGPRICWAGRTRWSAMYQARRDPAVEADAIAATRAFTAFLRSYIDARRSRPADDLITHLIAAEEAGEHLTTDEMISTCILLLNAGNEATLHMLGNGVKTLLRHRNRIAALAPDRVEATVEEILRLDPPLHLFTRHVYAEAEVMGHTFRRGDRVACLLAAANRDPSAYDAPARFAPGRARKPHMSFGAGVHFCFGAPLARRELQIALPILFARLPGLKSAGPARYDDIYHFHGLKALPVTTA